jgi:hypothetical protein
MTSPLSLETAKNRKKTRDAAAPAQTMSPPSLSPGKKLQKLRFLMTDTKGRPGEDQEEAGSRGRY